MDVFLPIELRHFPCYSAKSDDSGNDNPFISRNNDLAEGRVDLRNKIHVPLETSSPVELMHALGNVVKTFTEYLFGGKYGTSKEKRNIINSYIMNYRKYHFNWDKQGDFCSLSDRVLERVRVRLAICENSPQKSNDFILMARTCLDEKGKFTKTSTHDVIVFAFTILPYLLIDSIESDPVVWSLLTLFGAVSSFFNYCGGPMEAEYYQTLIHISKFILQMHVPPMLATVSFHLLDHLSYSYKNSGVFAETNAFPCEHLYLGFRKENIGGNNREKTVFNRKLYHSAGKYVGCEFKIDTCMGVRKAIPLVNEYTLSMPLERETGYIKRAFLNYLSDLEIKRNDDKVLLTLTDLELSISGLHGWQNGEYDYKDLREYSRPIEGDELHNNNDEHGELLWLTSNDDIDAFYNNNNLPRKTILHSMNYHILSSFSYDMEYRSIQKKFSDLMPDDFSNSYFAVVYTSNNRLHLFMIYGYIMFQDEKTKNAYINALACPVPVTPLIPLINSCCNFTVDLDVIKRYSQSFTLISLHRLHFEKLQFLQIDNTHIYGRVEQLITRQFKLFRSVLYTTEK